MNTVVLESPGCLRLTRTPPPSSPPPAGHAIVRVRRVGICGTDWHAYHGRQPFFTYPRILGHELGVEVEQINDPASALRPGDRCAIEPYLHCGTCAACRAGRTNCCADLRVLGVHIDGGMRERIVVPADKLHPSDRLRLDQLALVEMLGIGCHAAGRAQLRRGETALILGAGPIGLSIIPFAGAAGARVLVADVSESRLRACGEMFEPDALIDARHDLPARVGDLTRGDGPAVVFDATGNAQSMARCFDLVAHGGRIVFVGLFQGGLAFDDPNFHRREITLLASRNATAGELRHVIAMLERGDVDPARWITHRAPAAELPDRLRAWLSPDAVLVKAMIEF